MSKYLADYGDTTDFVDGEGCFLIDKNGKRYIDFLGGWCVSTVGWKHPKMMEVLQDTKNRGFYIPPSYSWPEWESFAKLLADITPGKLQRVFRATSGSEAVEMAMKIARAATGKKKIVSIGGVYHGHTYGAASVGVALTPEIAPGVPDLVKISLENGVEQFEKLARAGDVAAFLSEPILTNVGLRIPPADFYPKIAKICKDNGILLVMDEVATGFGRTGKLFASEHWNLEPDIMCLAKGFSGGYATIGATIVSHEVSEEFFGKGHRKLSNVYFPYYSTFGWMPNDMMLAWENVKLILENKLWENADKVGKYLLELIKPLESLPKVEEVRGIGMAFAIEFNKNGLAKEIYADALQNGLTLDLASPTTLFFSPPLIMDKEIAKKGADILIEVVKKHCS